MDPESKHQGMFSLDGHVFETRALGVLAIGSRWPSCGMGQIVGDFLGIGRVLQPAFIINDRKVGPWTQRIYNTLTAIQRLQPLMWGLVKHVCACELLSVVLRRDTASDKFHHRQRFSVRSCKSVTLCLSWRRLDQRTR